MGKAGIEPRRTGCHQKCNVFAEFEPMLFKSPGTTMVQKVKDSLRAQERSLLIVSGLLGAASIWTSLNLEPGLEPTTLF